MAQRLDRKTLLSENHRLKQRLDVAHDELRIIKDSRAYRTIRLVGHAINQFKKSPTVFMKTTVRKLIKGELGAGVAATHKKLGFQKNLEDQYKEWISLNEPDPTELARQSEEVGEFKKRPLISIITPVFNPPKDALVELIESVLAQTYDNFELCLQDFGSSDEIQSIIMKYAETDQRVKDLGAGENKGIADNSNTLLKKAKGQYVALLDHDDTLSPDALYENVKLLNETDYDFIYSDKDKIDEVGNRFDPFFKPDWSPEIMLNANYLTHLNVMKTTLVRRVGGWDTKTDGAQDWDLFLKVIAVSKLIGHISKVLYHWRVIATSTAYSIETKPYALQGQRNTIDSYLSAIGAKGRSYHEGAELLIEWELTNTPPLLIVLSRGLTGLRGFIAEARQLDMYDPAVVLHNYELPKSYQRMLTDRGIKTLQYDGDLAATLHDVVSMHKGRDVVLVNESVVLDIDKSHLKNLRGWLNVKGVKAVGPRVVDQNGFALDCGAFVTPQGLRPIFVGSPPYHQAAIGNIEWVRNLRVLTPLFSLMRADDIVEVTKNSARELKELDPSNFISAVHLILSIRNRLVFNPKTQLVVRSGAEVDAELYYEDASFLLDQLNDSGFDPYFNQNLSSSDPMALTTIEQSTELDGPLPEQEGGYQTEALVHAMNRSLTTKELHANFEHIKKTNRSTLENIQSALIILPDFQAIYAGLNNIFYFADKLQSARGVDVTFALLAQGDDCTRQRALIAEKYPELAKTMNIQTVSHDAVEGLPEVDIAICTQWATAYTLALYNKSKRKCYFIQDKESSFYPKGTISALVENTYKLGFFALANTEGLLDWYEKEFAGAGAVLRSRIDISKFVPPSNFNIQSAAPHRVFFYARPKEPRNAFEAGIAGLVELKKRMGDAVEIYTAGADWDPKDYGLEDVIENLGKIAYDKLPVFYRSMDVGMMFMYSGHPGVIASELMASGCPVVVNKYNDLTWNELYKQGVTALESGPTRDEIADALETVLTDTRVRRTLITNGLATVNDFYGNYDEAFETALESIAYAQTKP